MELQLLTFYLHSCHYKYAAGDDKIYSWRKKDGICKELLWPWISDHLLKTSSCHPNTHTPNLHSSQWMNHFSQCASLTLTSNRHVYRFLLHYWFSPVARLICLFSPFILYLLSFFCIASSSLFSVIPTPLNCSSSIFIGTLISHSELIILAVHAISCCLHICYCVN